jgi:hypothetical protein
MVRPCVLLAALSACSVQYSTSDIVAVQPDACIATHADILRQAMTDWNDAVGSHFVLEGVLAGQVPTATLIVRCATVLDERSDAAGDYDYAGHVTILREWIDAPEAKLEGLLVHELGHSLGAGHVEGSTNSMFWVAHTFDGISAEDIATVRCAQTGVDCTLAHADPAH